MITRRDRENERQAHNCRIKSFCCPVNNLSSNGCARTVKNRTPEPLLDNGKDKMKMGRGNEYKYA